MSSERNSAHWMPDLERICQKVHNDKLSKNGITYKKIRFGDISDFCDDMVKRIRHEMAPSCLGEKDCLLDRHKIVAVHIMGLLKNPVFIKKTAFDDETIVDILANEYCCVLFLYDIINGWSKSTGENKSLKIPEYMYNCLLKLFYKHRTTSQIRVSDTTFVYALSTIIFFVEKCFLT